MTNFKILPINVRADTNRDSQLNIEELARYINKQIRDHIETAIRTNPMRFAEIDVQPRDGLVSWDEYHSYFLRKKGLPSSYVDDHVESKHEGLDRTAKGMSIK